MNTSFDNKGRMVLEVNDILKITLDFEAIPEYRSHINGMQAINPDNWLLVRGEGSDGNSYQVWYFIENWGIELEDVDYTEPNDIEDMNGKIIWESES